MTVTIEKNTSITSKQRALLKLSFVLIGIFLSCVIFLLRGINPFYAFFRIFKGSFMSVFGLKETVMKAIPLLLISTGLVVAFRGRFWNIGAEGQFLMGATAATWVGLTFGDKIPYVVVVMFLVGFICGAIWGIIPAYLKVKLGINEIISTLMFNYIAYQFVQYLVYGPMKGKTKYGFPYTDNLPPQATIPVIPGTRIHLTTLLLGVALLVFVYLFISRTIYGYEIKVVGENPHAAKYAGISFIKVAIIVMLISGGLAGLAGVGEVAAIHKHLTYPEQITSGFGYTGIIVAWLSGLNPLLVFFSSFFFGGLLVGGDIIQTSFGFPSATIQIFNGLILISMLAGTFLTDYKIKVRR